MKRYVVGFLFDQARKRVVLIRKNQPAWQRGKLNGVGGKIESGETPARAMRREFQEETGVDIVDWARFSKLTGSGFELHCFYAIATAEDFASVKSMTDEPVLIFDVEEVGELRTIPNLQWLIPMALSMEHDRAIALS